MSMPLDGVTVVDGSQGIAGPYCCVQLADAGARVLKVEDATGDITRQWEPRTDDGLSVPFLSLNRHKEQVSLDLTKAPGQELLEDMVASADVVVVDQGGSVNTAVPWERARVLNSRLVYCVISGYGPRGPWAQRPGGELAAQMASEFSSSLGRIGDPPVRLGTDAAAMFAGIHAVQGVAAALLSGLSFERAERVDVSLFGSLITMRSTLWVALSNPDEWWGFHLDSYVKPPFRGFPCKDGIIYFELRGLTSEERGRLLDALGMSWAKADPRYPLLLADGAGGSGRYTHQLMDLWERGLAELSRREIIAIIERHGGVALPVNDYGAVMRSEQVRHLGVIGSYQGPSGKDLPFVRSPIHFEE